MSRLTVLIVDDEPPARRKIRRLLEAHPELELVAPKEIWGRERAQPLTGEDERFLELTPDRHDTDGFFAAILRRRR